MRNIVKNQKLDSKSRETVFLARPGVRNTSYINYGKSEIYPSLINDMVLRETRVPRRYIAATDDYLAGLTDKGHILQINQFDVYSKTQIKDQNWVYVITLRVYLLSHPEADHDCTRRWKREVVRKVL